MFKCLICNQVLSSKRGLANHIRTHGMTPTQYKEKFFKELHEGYEEGKDYLVCPICGEERWGQLVRHLHKAHNLTDEQIEELGIDVRTQWYHELQANAVSKAWKSGHRDHIGPKISKTKSENWTEDDSKRLYDARIATGAYSKIGKARAQHLIDKYDSYDDYLSDLMNRLTSAKRGKRIQGTDSFKEVVYRSSYEYALSLILHKLEIEFIYEPFFLTYYNTELKKDKKYRPDFLIESKNLILEVKPAYQLNDQEVIDKKDGTIKLG